MKVSKTYGFTLVELLIVMSIIGIVATVSIPIFQKMVRRAKQAEAKLQLGGIYRLQVAFRDEYGTFGNNLSFLGYEPDNLEYFSVGFSVHQSETRCVDIVSDPGIGIFPAALPTLPATYYNGGEAKGLFIVKNLPPTSGSAYIYCKDGYVTGSTFRVGAMGRLDGGSPYANTFFEALPKLDVWTIDETRTLVHEREPE